MSDEVGKEKKGCVVDITWLVNGLFALAIVAVIVVLLASFWQMVEGTAEIRNPRPVPTHAPAFHPMEAPIRGFSFVLKFAKIKE